MKLILALFLAALPYISHAGEEIPPSVMEKVKTVIHEYFKTSSEECFQIKPITGGFSATTVRLDFADKSYILRIIKESESDGRVQAELHSMKQAALTGVAPSIHWISADGRSILMDYISGGTLTIDQKSETLPNIATHLRKIHSLQKNPYVAPTFEDFMEKFYREHSKGSHQLEIWDASIALIREGSQQLEKLNSPSANIHGDLNPRNILVAPQKLYFIDWSEGMYTEPFHDLAYFSILMDYGSSEDDLLLNSYLQRQPTSEEKQRFLIAKKMNFARIAMATVYISSRLPIEEDSPPKDLSYYVNAFANNEKNLTGRFFLNFAKATLQSANTLK